MSGGRRKTRTALLWKAREDISGRRQSGRGSFIPNADRSKKMRRKGHLDLA